MKSVCLSALLLLSASLPAQAPVPLAHGDVPGEPHHHLKIENSYVRAYYVEVPAHADTELHQHDHDYIFVSLGPGDVINAVRDKPEVHLVLTDGEVHFSRGGFAHVARNLSDAPFRNVTIELLRPQGEPKNLCDKVVPGDAGPCIPERRINKFTNSPSFETDAIKVDSLELQPKVGYGDVPETDVLLVALDRAELTVEVPGKPETRLSGGDSLWISRRTSLTIRNPGDRPSRFLSIKFKEGAVGAAK